MMGSVFANIESLDDYNDDNDDVVRGYKDDREQLNVPTIQKSQSYYLTFMQFLFVSQENNLTVDDSLL